MFLLPTLQPIRRNTLWLLLLIFLVTSQTSAQPQGMALGHITSQNGLSHDMVLNLGRDTAGYVWMGTYDGLTRYDGRYCVVYRNIPGDSTSLPDNRIRGITCEPGGRMWVATNKGLAWFDAAKRTFHSINIQPPEGTAKSSMSALAFDGKGHGWSVGSGYLLKLNLKTFEQTFYDMRKAYTAMTQTFVDGKGRVWVMVDGYLFLFNDKTQKAEPFDVSGKSSHGGVSMATRLGADLQGNFWISTWGHGMMKFDETQNKFWDYPDGLDAVISFSFDKHPEYGDLMWVGVGDKLGVVRLKDTTVHYFTTDPREPYGHNAHTVYDLMRDHSTGVVWVATNFGVEKYDPGELKFARHFLDKNIYQGDQVAAHDVYESRTVPGRFYIQVWNKGLLVWDRPTDMYRALDSKTSVYHLILDSKNRCWLGKEGSVDVVDPDNFRTLRTVKFSRVPGRPAKAIFLVEDGSGAIWVGTNNDGMARIDPVTFTVQWIDLEGIPNQDKLRIWRMYTDPKKRLLLCTDELGFFRYDPATGKTDDQYAKGKLPIYVTDLVFDRNHHLWVCAEGVWRFDENDRVVDTLTLRDGLRHKTCNSIEVDAQNRIWISTYNGVHRYDPVSKTFDVFTAADGLIENFTENHMRTLSTGELFVGFQSGFNIARTERLPVNRTPPRVWLNGVSVLNKPIEWEPGRPIVLYPGENVVTFDFSVIQFTQSDKNRLIYKLEGFDKTWQDLPQTPITYTNLDGGRYTLHVRARTGEGVESSNELAIPLQVIPPFTRSRWFIPLLLLLGIGIISAIGYYRLLQRRKLSEIRTRIARDLHDDIGSGLSSIRFFSEVVKNQVGATHPESAPLLERMSDNAHILADNMRDIVWAIGGKHDEIDDLVSRIREFALHLCESRNIRFDDQLPQELPKRRLRPDQVRNIYLIAKEAVNNAAKYGNATTIGVRLELNRSDISLAVTDDGIGFDTNSEAAGNGLHNMRQRAAEIGGTLVIKSEVGKGTRVSLVVKS
ncbi:MAG: hypothetical protein IT270_03910 [Saprospiraceae bacterium]|nr:hypothetical protein [Saprospiraceae bacterium]